MASWRHSSFLTMTNMVKKDCPIYSQNHLENLVSSCGKCEIQTKSWVDPKLTGTFLLLPLHQLTTVNTDDDAEDQGADDARHQQELRDKRIKRRVPLLIQSVLENPHPNLMVIYGFIRHYDTDPVQNMTEGTDMRNVTHAIYEYCPRILREYENKDMDLQFATNWAYELISAVEHLHDPDVGVMHRRINPEAIYIFEDKGQKLLKLGNILFARKVTQSGMTAERAPFAYVAPEALLSQNAPTANYGLPADIWSYGMVLYFITHRKDPFDKKVAGRGTTGLSTHISVEANRPELDPSVDSLLKNIIESCWKVKPEDRPTANEIKRKLADRINSNSQP